jgi:hypothetical protein
MSTAFYGQDASHDRPAERRRRHQVGAHRRLPPAQTTPASQYFPDGLVFQGVSIGARAELHGSEIIPGGQGEPALVQLGAARRRSLRVDARQQNSGESVLG